MDNLLENFKEIIRTIVDEEIYKILGSEIVKKDFIKEMILSELEENNRNEELKYKREAEESLKYIIKELSKVVELKMSRYIEERIDNYMDNFISILMNNIIILLKNKIPFKKYHRTIESKENKIDIE